MIAGMGSTGDVELGRILDFAVARSRATQNHWRERSLAYVTRGLTELLIFQHIDDLGDAGVQVPGGGIEPGESPAQAALRELREEAGLTGSNPVYLESREWPTEVPSRIRHYFWVEAPPGTPDAWEHEVVSGDEDHGSVHRLRFVDVRAHGLSLGHGFESGLTTLLRMMESRHGGR